MSPHRSDAVDEDAGRGVEDDGVCEVVVAAELAVVAGAGGGSSHEAVEHEVLVVVVRVGGPLLAAQAISLCLSA